MTTDPTQEEPRKFHREQCLVCHGSGYIKHAYAFSTPCRHCDGTGLRKVYDD